MQGSRWKARDERLKTRELGWKSQDNADVMEESRRRCCDDEISDSFGRPAPNQHAGRGLYSRRDRLRDRQRACRRNTQVDRRRSSTQKSRLPNQGAQYSPDILTLIVTTSPVEYLATSILQGVKVKGPYHRALILPPSISEKIPTLMATMKEGEALKEGEWLTSSMGAEYNMGSWISHASTQRCVLIFETPQ